MKKSAWLRLALILVCAAMMLSLFACGGGEAVETEGSSKKPETEATEKQTESETTEGTEETEPQVDTTETETKEATTEEKVDTTETEKKPVETTETEKKPVETTEKPEPPVVEADPLKIYIGPDKLAAASVNANRLDAGVVSADGSYVTYKNKADGGDGYVQVYGGGAVVSGQYLVIKYRYPTSNQTTATNIEIFSSTVNGGPTGGDNTRMPVKADGEWHLAVVDMAACKGEEKFPAGADGKYTVKYARFDVLDGNHVAGDSIDVAYAGITDDPAEVIALAKKEGVKTIDYTAASNKSETYYSSTGTTTPTPADVANVFIGPEQLASASVNTGRISGKEVSKDGSYARFTANGTGGDGYALVLSGGAEVSGQYLIIKYRYPTTSKQTYLEIFASCTNAGPTGGDNIRFNVKTDGEWHVQVVDFADFNSKFTANEDGTYTVKYARVDLLDSNSTAEGETVDIAYVAFADDYQNVLKANGDSKTVDYRLGAEEIYSLYTSTGTELPAMTDVANKYFDAEDLAGKAPSGTNIGKVELSEDKSYVSIYGKGAGDGFFAVFSGNTDVTGQYLIMKYRYPATNAEGYAPNARPLFAGNVMNGPTGGDTTGSFPVVADGMPEDCCIDIQYIALTDDVNNLLPVAKGEGLYTVEARLTADGTVVYYPDTNSTEPPVDDDETGTEVEGEETETETQTEGEIVEVNPDEEQGDVDYDAPFFQFSIDFINDARSAGRSGASAMYKDFAPYSTSAEGIIDIKGWFFGMSGVASYEFSVDGGATWITLPDTATNYTYGSDPDGIDKLIINKNTQLLGTPGFGVNANFRGGASLKINLSHLAHDEKVSITVSAVLNSGDRVEFLKLLDVFVACTHEDNTAEWTAIEGDIQRLASTCSACGKEVTKFIDYTTEGLKLAGAGYLASKKTMGGKTSVSLRQEANGMYYAHFEVTETFTAENNLLVWSGSTIPNVDKFVAFLYRVNTNTSGTEMFISADSSLNGTHQNYPPIIVGGWQLAIVDCTTKDVWTKETGVWQLRLDLFNSRSSGYKVGDYADLAYLAFFSSKDAAIDFYATYVDTYLGAEDCAHARVSGEWQWTGVEGEYKQKATCLLCEADVVRDCPHESSALVPVTEKGENGELYEAFVCNSCKYSTQRPVYYYNSIDAIYGGPDGATVINPATRNNYQQTDGVNGAPVSGYLTFDATGKLIDKDKNPIQVTNIFSFSGWLGVNGGVDRYVYKINDGAWTTPSGSAGTVGADSGIGKAIVGNAGIVDKTGSFKNASYQGKLKVMGMQAYADQTISITIGAVPANNPGSAEDPNVIILAVVNNLYVTCIHTDPANEWVKTDTEGEITCVCVDCGETITKVCDHVDDGVWVAATEEGKVCTHCKVCESELNVKVCDHPDITKLSNVALVEGKTMTYAADCAVCGGRGEFTNINQEGLLVFTPNVIDTFTTNGKYTHTVATDPTTNNMPYYHAVNTAGAEGTLTLNSDPARLMGVGKYVAVLYRKSVGIGAKKDHMQLYVNNTSTAQWSDALNTSYQWQLDVIDLSSKGVDPAAGYGWTRLDIFDPVNHTDSVIKVGDVTDIAYIGFFNSKAAATAYYGEFAKQYLGEANCVHSFGAFAAGEEGYKTATCAWCGFVAVEHDDVTDENLKVYNPSIFLAGNSTNGNFYGRYSATANGMPYFHFATKQAEAEGWYVLNDGAETIKVGSYIGILYRKTAQTANYGIQVLTTPAGTTGSTGNSAPGDDSLNINGEWDLLVLKTGTANPENGFGWTRVDMINAANALLGDTVDIAYVGFFSTADAAWAYYEAYREEYSLPRPSVVNFKINFDAGYVTVNGTKYIEKGMGATDKPLEIDYTGATLNSVDSMSVGGWCVTPGGVKTYSYYVIDKATGVRSQIKQLCVGGDQLATPEKENAIQNEGLKANYPTSCGLGAGFQGIKKFNLVGFEGKTVDIEMVIVTNFGTEAVVAKLTNITVPTAPATE